MAATGQSSSPYWLLFTNVAAKSACTEDYGLFVMLATRNIAGEPHLAPLALADVACMPLVFARSSHLRTVPTISAASLEPVMHFQHVNDNDCPDFR